LILLASLFTLYREYILSIRVNTDKSLRWLWTAYQHKCTQLIYKQIFFIWSLTFLDINYKYLLHAKVISKLDKGNFI
jgi:hypothetical protein